MYREYIVKPREEQKAVQHKWMYILCIFYVP